LYTLLAENALHFGLRCEEPTLDSMKLTVVEDGGPDLWTGDDAELSPDTGDRVGQYFHVMVNAAGQPAVWLRGRATGRPRPPRVTARAQRGAGNQVPEHFGWLEC
jgi:hypothetical protein